jgi:hypothetical protein
MFQVLGFSFYMSQVILFCPVLDLIKVHTRMRYMSVRKIFPAGLVQSKDIWRDIGVANERLADGLNTVIFQTLILLGYSLL